MNRVRMVAVVAAALAVAVGAGTLFQSGVGAPEGQADARPATGAAQGQVSLVDQLAPGEVVQAALPEPEQIEPTALVEDEPRIDTAPEMPLRLTPPTLAEAPQPDEPIDIAAATPELLPADEALLAEIEACARWLVVTAEAGAMLDLSLFAPCDGGATVRLEHAGLRLDGQIGADGQLALTLPALSAEGEVSVIFADDARVSDAALVPDLALHDRVLLQWQGPAVLALNAYEFEAEFGSAGHIHPANAGAPAQAAHGALVRLGHDEAAEPLLAQVYSYPMGLSARLGQVELELEVAVTEASCGRSLAIELMPVLDGAPGEPHHLTLSMPECDGEGGFLVLKNLLPALTIALN